MWLKIFQILWSNKKTVHYLIWGCQKGGLIIEKALKNHENFSDWFNKMFEQMKLQNDEEEGGYDDWLKNSECNDIINNNVVSLLLLFVATQGKNNEIISCCLL